MERDTHELQAILARIEALEKENRRLKRWGLVALVLATALGAIFATQLAPEKITAREFEVVDSSGKTRAQMGLMSGEPGIILYDGQGEQRVELGMLFRESGRTLRESNPGISFTDPRGNALLGMGLTSSGSSWVVLSDQQGFRMNLGTTQTINPATGETRETSAASLVMFGKDGKVIWSAP